MRFVKNLNENYFFSMIIELGDSFQGMKDKVVAYCGPIDFKPAQTDNTTRSFPFPIAAELWNTYQYLIGERKQPEHLHEHLLQVCEIVWRNPFLPGAMGNIEWEIWERTKLGAFVRQAFIAIALENGETINSKQLSLMAGITASGLVKQIREGKIKAERGEREWVIEAEHALTFLKHYVDAAMKGGEVHV